MKFITLLTISLLPFLFVPEVEAMHTDDISYSLQVANDYYSVNEDDSVLMDVLHNDGGDALGNEPIVVVAPLHGTLVKDGAHNFLYSPHVDFYSDSLHFAVDSFQYELGGTGLKAWAYVDQIVGVNDQPTAILDSFFVKQGKGDILANVLANDVDHDKVGLEVCILDYPKHGDVVHSSDAITYENRYLYFPLRYASEDLNDNLLYNFDERTMAYMNDTNFVYTPDATYYGYDSMHYIIKEYRTDKLDLPLPLPDLVAQYKYAFETDADTATVIFYIEPIDYLPVAVADTVLLSEDDAIDVPQHVFYPCANDLDADTISSNPRRLFHVPYILKDTLQNEIPASDTIYFAHEIPEFSSVTNTIVFRKDSNMAVLLDNEVLYHVAAGFSGVDSLYYSVIEAYDSLGRYPEKFRGDTSNYAKLYFVVAPDNDACYPQMDTLAFDPSLSFVENGKRYQYLDALSNDSDIDAIDFVTHSTFRRLLGEGYTEEMSLYGTPYLKNIGASDILYTAIDPSIGQVFYRNDSLLYQYESSYPKSFLIDSFSYYIYDGTSQQTVWAMVSNVAVEANDVSTQVAEPFVINEDGSAIATQIPISLYVNDGDNDSAVFVLANDDHLSLPYSSIYAEVRDAGGGNANYFHHVGFELADSFQYVVTDYLTLDTAWVFVDNILCEAESDTFEVHDNPFAKAYDSNAPYVQQLDVLSNDVDAENILSIVFLNAADTLRTLNGTATIASEDGNSYINYAFNQVFFYEDSFQYVLTDIPVEYAEVGLFTRDTAWIHIKDVDFLVDSDGDGIVNTLEDGIEGYQLGEDTLDFDEDGLPNYLDVDADGDGMPDFRDCDGDGILNFVDEDNGCSDVNVPNMFTPNGDGINDLFEIPELILSTYSVVPTSMKIYNRLGQLLYDNDFYGQDDMWWDGTVGDVVGLSIGSELPDGVYFYHMIYADGKFKKDGFVHIKR